MLGSSCGRLGCVHHGVVREFLVLTLDDLVSFRVAARIAHCVSCPTPYRLALSLRILSLDAVRTLHRRAHSSRFREVRGLYAG